jgi:hypothetical protein
VILLGDSLWDVGMIEWFDYNNLIKIWFLNEWPHPNGEGNKTLEEYKKNYDLVLTGDNDWNLLCNLFN